MGLTTYILQGSGRISNAAMERHVLAEYAKYNMRRLKAPEQVDNDDYIINDLNEAVKIKK